MQKVGDLQSATSVQVQQIQRDMNGIRSYASEINALKMQINGNLELIENRYTKKEVDGLFDTFKPNFVRVKEIKDLKRVVA